MDIERIADLRRLEQLAADWNCLAHGNPFHSSAWITAAMGRCGGGREPYFLAAFDERKTLVGLLPLLCERSPSLGRVLRFPSAPAARCVSPAILATVEHSAAVAAGFAEFLLRAARGGDDRWDQWILADENGEDAGLTRVISLLAEDGHTVSRKTAGGTWHIALPDSWKAFEQRLSTSFRKQLRRGERRQFAAGRANVAKWESKTDLLNGLDVIRGLAMSHPRRDADRVPPPAAEAFIAEMVAAFAATNQAVVYVLSLDGRPAAADLVFLGGSTAYADCSGWSAPFARQSPGSLLQQWILRDLIAAGVRSLELCDASPAFARHWRAMLRPAREVRIQAAVRPIPSGMSLPGEAMRTWMKSGITLNGM